MREISHDVRIEPPLLEVSTQEITDLPKSVIKRVGGEKQFTVYTFSPSTPTYDYLALYFANGSHVTCFSQ